MESMRAMTVQICQNNMDHLSINIFIFSKRRLYLIAIFGVLLVAYYFIFVEPFFPNQSGGLGHDYEMWFPRMLAGVYYFVTNGFTVIPWFTPSFCGGTVLFAHPQSIFFSIPQFLNFYFDPILSIQLTFMIFAVLGLWGTYLELTKKSHENSFLDLTTIFVKIRKIIGILNGTCNYILTNMLDEKNEFTLSLGSRTSKKESRTSPRPKCYWEACERTAKRW